MCDQAEFVVIVRSVNDRSRFAYTQSIPLQVFDRMYCAEDLYPHILVDGLNMKTDQVEVLFQCSCGAIQNLTPIRVAHVYQRNQRELCSQAVAYGHTSTEEIIRYVFVYMLYEAMVTIRAQVSVDYAVAEYANYIGRQIHEGAILRQN